MLSLLVAAFLALVIVLLSRWGIVLQRQAYIYQRLSRQCSNMSLSWEDRRFHPERKICRKHAEFSGENQPEGKCPECGVMIRYNVDPKYVFPTMPTAARKLKKYFEKLFIIPAMKRKFVATPAVSESFYHPDPEKLFVINVVFYDADMVELHYDSLKAFFKDPFEYFVLDNTDEAGRSKRVRDYCASQKINYVRLPAHDAWARWHDSTSHGLALSWCYANIIKRFRPRVFGFVDGDLFPTEPVSIIGLMENTDAWGIVSERWPFWHFWSPVYYLWPGLSFWKTSHFAGRTPNFMPGWGVDTAGRELLDGKKMMGLPEVFDYHSSPWTEVAPDVYVHLFGKFNHFTGGSWQPLGAEAQKKWMRSVIESGGKS